MSVAKGVLNKIAIINKSNAGETLRAIGEQCVRKSYAGDDETTQYALDNLAQWARMPLASWLRARGLIIKDPITNSARFIVEGVKNPKRQSKAIEESKTETVLMVEHKVKQEKKVKPLEGLAADRGHDAMVKLLKSLRKVDPDAAAWVNDVWATKIDKIETEQIAAYVPMMLKAVGQN